jgi:hypothetical protein
MFDLRHEFRHPLLLDHLTGHDIRALVDDRVGQGLAVAEDLEAAIGPLGDLHRPTSPRERPGVFRRRD